MLTDATTDGGLGAGGSAAALPLGPTARAVADVARSLGIPCRRWGPELLQLGQGNRQRLLPVSEADPSEAAADPGARDALRAAGVPLATVAARSSQVLVVGWRAIAVSHRSAGGEHLDLTDRLPPEVARLAERAADVLGLDVANVEVADGAVVSVTGGARLDWHPARARAAARELLRLLFPRGTPSRVPLVVTCDAEGVGQCLADLLGEQGVPVGVGRDARVLGHPHIEAAVISRTGARAAPPSLGFDRADLVVVGPGAATEATLPVVRRLARHGALVVHVEHPALGSLAAATDARLVVHCAGESDHPLLHAQLVSGGSVGFVSADDAVVVRERERMVRVRERFSTVAPADSPSDRLAAVIAAWFLVCEVPEPDR